MTALGLGDIAGFPFVDPPDRRSVTRRRRRCCRSSARSTPGRPRDAHPARPHAWPSCPSTRGWAGWCSRRDRQRLRARGDGHRRRAVDPGPARAAGRAPAGGRRRRTPGSPTRTRTSSRYLNLWRYLREQQRELSSQPVPPAVPRRVPQLPAGPRVAGPGRASCARSPRSVGVDARARPPARTADRVHTALLPGLLSHIGLQATPRQAGLPRRPRREVRHLPGLGAVTKQPRWVMAAELVETSRLWARRRRGSSRSGPSRWPGTWSSAATASRTGRPARLGHGRREGHAVRRADRRRPDGQLRRGSTPSCPASCSSGTRWSRATGAPTTRFFAANRALLEEVEELEDRARRRDILVDDETLFALLRRADPGATWSRRAHFDSWWKKARHDDPDLLTFTRETAARRDRDAGRPRTTTPTRGTRAALALPLTLPVRAGRRRTTASTVAHPARRCSPGATPRTSTGRCRAARGARHRAHPLAAQGAAPAGARAGPGPRGARPRCGRDREPLLEALGDELRRRTGRTGRRSTPVDLARCPAHLRMTFRVRRRQGRRCWPRARTSTRCAGGCAPKVRATIAGTGGAATRAGRHAGLARDLPDGGLPRTARRSDGAGGTQVTVFPALVDEGGGRSRSGCSRPRRSSDRRWARAPAGCSCSPCRHRPAVPRAARQHGRSWLSRRQAARARRRHARRLRRRRPSTSWSPTRAGRRGTRRLRGAPRRRAADLVDAEGRRRHAGRAGAAARARRRPAPGRGTSSPALLPAAHRRARPARRARAPRVRRRDRVAHGCRTSPAICGPPSCGSTRCPNGPSGTGS